MGELYAAGDGVDVNPKLAQMFSARACALGDGKGCGNNGISHQLGFGVKADPARAAKFYKKACEAGEASYCALLARFEEGSAAAAPAAPDAP
jgi:TPR repeat protein